MDKNNSNNSSSSSVCTKIRQALTSNPAFRAVQRITSFNQQEPTNKPFTKGPNSQSSITNIIIQNKPHHPHHKAHTEGSGSGSIPIKFDNGNYSAVSSTVANGKQHVPMQQGKQPEGNNKKKMDINDHFKDFIQNTREKMMRSVTNIGWTHQSNHAAAPEHGEAQNKNESHFSEFIQRARKKLRTTTTVRKNNN
ncbi:hypothetical protein JHK87_026602 [Glycine soja]|nr:hypothetical protein JHK87_026602 [Glycine soja]